MLLHHPPVLLIFLLKQSRESLFKRGEFLGIVYRYARKGGAIVSDPCKSFGKLVKLLLPRIYRADNIFRCQIVDVPQRNTG